MKINIGNVCVVSTAVINHAVYKFLAQPNKKEKQNFFYVGLRKKNENKFKHSLV